MFVLLQFKLKQNNMKTIFKVGDAVYCCIHGEGRVVKANDEGISFPIAVDFENVAMSYTVDGRLFHNSNPTLSFTPYTLEGFSQERKADWNGFIGEYGFHFNKNENGRLLAKLETLIESHNWIGFKCAYGVYDYFQPLTPEIKQSLIEQGVINPSNSTPLDK